MAFYLIYIIVILSNQSYCTNDIWNVYSNHTLFTGAD